MVSWVWYEFVLPSGMGRWSLFQRCPPEPPTLVSAVPARARLWNAWTMPCPGGRSQPLTPQESHPDSYPLSPCHPNETQQGGCYYYFSCCFCCYFSETAVKRCGCHVKEQRVFCHQPVHSLSLFSLFQLKELWQQRMVSSQFCQQLQLVLQCLG